MEVLRPLYLAVVRLYPEYWVQTCLQEKKKYIFLWFTWAENKKKKKRAEEIGVLPEIYIIMGMDIKRIPVQVKGNYGLWTNIQKRTGQGVG